ncbi:papain-like cysteine protease family protein [Rhizobium sp. CB3090]|uniref:papain-like cysteine protease family protein n=1 Tax=Rhizobium sp. CB3090 TaxID=3039156 RepID=UPI0024B2856F|nr:papain-like cysteine protease family protein [Rhizobium sp. CB3090]WFU10355.1 papain-like cysteine protease family protein [Rhizobium sp. CB3090]
MTLTFKPVTTLLSWAWKKYPLSPVRTKQGLQIQFEMQSQIMTLWCWAAAASSVSFYLDRKYPVTQKQIVAQQHGFDEKAELDDEWNKEGHLREALEFVLCLASIEIGPVSFRSVIWELGNGRPVLGQIEWDDGSGHAIALSGCRIDDDDNEYYTVEDPGVDPSVWERENPTQWVLANYWDVPGEWTHTFFVKAP